MRVTVVTLSLAFICGLAMAAVPSDASYPVQTTLLGTAGLGSRDNIVAPSMVWTDNPDETLHYDGPNANGLGLTSGGKFQGAQRLTPAEACSLKSVLFFHYARSSNDFVKVYAAGTETQPGALLDSAPYTGTDSGWVRVNLRTPVFVNPGMDFWVAAQITHTAGIYPLGLDAGPMVRDRGGFVSLDGGVTWQQIGDLGIDANVNVRGIVVRASAAAHDVGTTVVLAPNGNVNVGPVTPRATIKNFGTSAESNIPVVCWIDSSGTRVYNHTITYPGPLAPNATANVDFTPDWTTGPAGVTYSVKTFTDLTGDVNRANDTARATCRTVSYSLNWATRTQGPDPARYWCPANEAVRDTIFFLGGRTASAPSIRLIQAYVPAADAWVTDGLGTLLTPRRAGTGGRIGNKIYVVGGRDSSSATLNTCQVYDVDTKTCSTKANMPSARWATCGAVAGGKLYVVGGDARDGNTYEYDPVANTWATKATLTIGRGWSAAAGAAGKLYVMGGAGASTALNDCWMFDPASNTWTQKANMPGTREYHEACTYNDTLIFVFGGSVDGVVAADGIVYRYHVPSNTWSLDNPMPTARGWEMPTQVGDKLYVAFGSNCTTPTYLRVNEEASFAPSAVFEYNPNRYYTLHDAVPSLVRDYARISFDVARRARVNLSIYDASGSLVRTLASGVTEPGLRTVTWDRTANNGTRVSSGTYIYRLTVDGVSVAGKAIVLE